MKKQKKQDNRQLSLEKCFEEFQKEYYASSPAVLAETSDFYSSFNSYNSSAVRASVANRLLAGGRRVVYTVATMAMLQNNFAQHAYAAFTPIVQNQTVYNEYVSSGYQYIWAGGRAVDGTVGYSGYQYISSGGVASNMMINSSGYQYVSYGGSALNTIITSNGMQWVSSGGFTSGTKIVDYGSQYVDYGGSAIDNTILSGQQYVSNSGWASNNYFSANGQQQVMSYGSAYNNQFYNSWGYQYINGNNALASGNYFYGTGGGQQIGNSASAYGNYFYGSGLFNQWYSQGVSYGGYASGNYYYTNGSQYMYYSGWVNDTVFNQLGSQYLYSSASAYNTVFNNGGWQQLSTYARAYGTVLNGGMVTSSGYTNYYGASQMVYSYASAMDTTINSGGVQWLYNSAYASNTTINDKGSQYISSYGSAYNNTINSGGSQYVYSYGLASGTSINSGGSSFLQAFASASGTVLNNGGIQTMNSGAKNYNMSQNSGGVLNFSVYAGDANTVITGTNASGAAMSLSNGVASNFIVYNSGSMTMMGGSAVNAEVASGGRLNMSGGSAIGAVQDSGGNINTSVGGNTIYITGTNQDGAAITQTGNVATNFIINSGGYQYVNANGSTVNATVNSGGNIYVQSGGSAINVTQNSGGNVNASAMGGNMNTYVSGTNQDGTTFTLSNGVASNFIMNSGGSLTVVTGGLAQDTTLNSGGALNVSWGGSAYNVVQNSGGNINLSAMGGDAAIVSGTNQDGTSFKYSGGSASNFIVNSGGWQSVGSGGSAIDTAVNSGGWMYVSSGKATGVVQNQGGNISVYMYAGDIYTYVSGTNESGGRLYYSNGVASGFVLNSGIWQSVNSGVSAYDFTVNSGANLSMYSGGSAIGLNVSSGGMLYVSAVDGNDHTTYISGTNQYGSQMSLSNGVGSGFVISGNSSSYNSLYVSNGGKVYNTVIGGYVGSNYINSGVLSVASNGSAIGTIVNSGGMLSGYSNAEIISTTINGGYASGYSGVNFTDTVINGGFLSNGSGNIKNTVVNSDGFVGISSGNAENTTINYGGFVSTYSANFKNTVINSGGFMSAYSTNMQSTTINDGGFLSAGYGTYISTVIKQGGTQVLSSGVDTGAVVEGLQYLSYGANAFNANIKAGGTQYLTYNTNALNTSLNGGFQYVGASANALNTVINSGGVQEIAWGGFGNAVINQGGLQIVNAGAKSTDTVVNSGGRMNIQMQAVLMGNTQINQGGVVSGATVDIDTVTLNSGGLWTNAGESTINNLYMNGGTLDIRGSVPGMWRMFTVDNFTATGSSIIDMNVMLGIDNSMADLLVVQNSFDGKGLIRVHNVYGTGAQTTADGIRVVEIQNGANGDFGLVGGKADAGAYEYKLFQGGITSGSSPDDFFLRSTERTTNTFRTMQNIPEMNAIMARTGMNSLEKRLGDLRALGSDEKHNGIWARTYAKKLTVKGDLDTDMSLYGLEAGYDYLFNPGDPNKIYIGFMAGYMQNGSVQTQQDDGQYGKGNGDAPSVGIYGTWLNDNGWFVDIAARNFWTKLDMTNYDAGGTALIYSPERNILAASVEIGKAFKFEMGGKDYLRFEPKGELLYMNAGSGSTPVINGVGNLSYDAASYMTAKASLLLGYAKTRSNGLMIEPYLELGYSNEFTGKGDVHYAGATYQTDLTGSTVSGAAGLNMQLTKDTYIYGQGSYETGNKIKGYGGNLGIRVAFGGVDTSVANKPARPIVVKEKKEKAAPVKAAPEVKQQPATQAQPQHTGTAPVIYYINNYPYGTSAEPAQYNPPAAKAVAAETEKLYASVAFDTGHSALTATDKDYLRQMAAEIKRLDFKKIIITGRTDNVGAYKKNKELSFERAKAVAQELERSGIPSSKMELRAEPVDGKSMNTTVESRARNRTADIIVISAER